MTSRRRPGQELQLSHGGQWAVIWGSLQLTAYSAGPGILGPSLAIDRQITPSQSWPERWLTLGTDKLGTHQLPESALPGCHCWLNTRYGWLSNFKIQLDAVTSLAWGEYTFKWLLIRKLCDNCPDWFRDWWYLWPWPWPWSMVTPTSAWFPRFR